MIKKTLMIAGCIALVSFAANAQENKYNQTTEAKSPLKVKIGLGGIYSPDYEGSDDYEAKALPSIDIRYSDLVKLNFQDGLRLNLLATFEDVVKNQKPKTKFEFGPVARYRFGRDESDNNDLRGMGNLDAAVELGGYASLLMGSLGLDLALVQAVNDGSHEGMVADFSANYRMRFSKDFSLGLGPSLSWADDNYMQANFGVSATQSANSGMNRFNAKSGIKNAGFSLNSSYSIDQNWSLSAVAGYKRMLGDAADSPLVAKRGAENQYFGGAFIVFGF